MTSSNLSWQEAIVRVLEEAGEPLHYQEITRRIGAQGLRELSGATPANSANRSLNAMVTEGNPSYDERIRKTGSGIFRFLDSSITYSDKGEETSDIVDEEPAEDRAALVPAFGLYWERDKVQWDSGQILGRQTPNSNSVNFAEQQGVYMLLKGRYVVYVGRTTDSLYNRLKSHIGGSRGPRWDGFSWFGLRDVDEDGKLSPLDSELSTEDVITVIESVLIEALEPPINGRRGDRMGALYEQVIDPRIQVRQNYDILATLGTSLQELVSRS